MEAKSLAVSALQGVGTRIVETGANKAIKSLPPQKQNKIRGILMIVGAAAMLMAGLKMMKKRTV